MNHEFVSSPIPGIWYTIKVNNDPKQNNSRLSFIKDTRITCHPFQR